jgi:hypothetical protein
MYKRDKITLKKKERKKERKRKRKEELKLAVKPDSFCMKRNVFDFDKVKFIFNFSS